MIYGNTDLSRGSVLENVANPMDKMPHVTKSKADITATNRKQLDKYKMFFEKHKDKYSDDDIDFIRKYLIS